MEQDTERLDQDAGRLNQDAGRQDRGAERLNQDTEQQGSWLREFWLDCLALLWPTVCVGCGRTDRDLCAQCFRELSEGGIDTFDPGGVGVQCFAAGPYDGVTRAALIAYKHQGMFGLVRPLGRRLMALLRLACEEASRDPPIIVTIPSRAKRVRERGYQHLDELVKVARRELRRELRREVRGDPPARYLPAQHMSLLKPVLKPVLEPVLKPVLRPLRGRTGQVGLDVQAREENARRIAVRKLWAPDLVGREVILVDDIVTTGATVRAAQEVLEAAGARVIAVVALCAAVRRDTPKMALETEHENGVGFDERRNGASHGPTRLSHLGGRHGRKHPRSQCRDN